MKHIDNFVKTVMNIKTEGEMRDFLRGILTPKELIEIPTRLEIVKMLKARVPQQKIATKLKVGIATVTRGSKELQKGYFQTV